MQGSDSVRTELEVEQRILELLQHHRTLTFAALVEAAPEYRWGLLVAVLHRLRQHDRITMTAPRWGCDVIIGLPDEPCPKPHTPNA